MNKELIAIANLVNEKKAQEKRAENQKKIRTLILRDNAIAEWHRILPELKEGFELLKEISDIHHRISDTSFVSSNFVSRFVFCPGYGVMANHYQKQDEIIVDGITYSISKGTFDYCGQYTIIKTTTEADTINAFVKFVKFVKTNWDEILKEAEKKIKEEANKYLAS